MGGTTKGRDLIPSRTRGIAKLRRGRSLDALMKSLVELETYFFTSASQSR